MANIKDVAKEAGVSVTTVSRVMNNRGYISEKTRKKVYDAIDNSDGFYVGHADKDSRSFMNVTFRLPSEELEAKFAKEALEHGLGGVKGHRSVGGMRTSIYNAMPMEGCQALVDFMEKFRKANK